MDEVILSIDFSKNYDNEQRHDTQSAYFGHECFTQFTAACYFNRSVAIENGKIDKEANLVHLPVVIVSNETLHDRDVAFSNNILIDMIKKLEPSINTFPFAVSLKIHILLIFILSCRNQFDLELWKSSSL